MTARVVYFLRPIGFDGPIKIGCSTAAERRTAGLHEWSPFPLELLATIPGDFKLENAIHGHFWEDHSHWEWFRASEALTAFVTALQNGVPFAEAIGPTFGTKKRPRKGPHWTQTPNGKLRNRYTMAFNGVQRRLRNQGYMVITPVEVDRIMAKWRLLPPSDGDMAYLDRVLADPSEHYLTDLSSEAA